MTSPTFRVAQEEWRALTRNRAGLIAAVLLVLLSLVATVASLDRHAAAEADRHRYQMATNRDFDRQPARHPHRMVHYGQFVFRPLPPLAFFDAGVDGYTGTTVFLEGHRQNSANFAEARQSSLLLRFGQLTPAFVLQVIAPLLLIFLAFPAVAREREGGTLRLLLAQGLGGRRLLAGKLLAHGVVALVVGAPAFLALLWFAVTTPGASTGAALLLVASYAGWLLIWAMVSVIVSAQVPRARDALTILIGSWLVIAILLPRALPGVAATRAPIPTRIETEIALHRDLARIGDSHDADDPYFAGFKARTLARYGVTRVEDLPVQYAGLVALEGERLSTELYARAAADAAELEARQNGLVHAFAALSPLIAIRQASMALTGSDPAAHGRFLAQAEAFRYRFVQALNRMQADKIPNVNAGIDPRISADNWRAVPRFAFAPPDPLDQRGVIAAHLLVLVGWLGTLAMLAVPVARRLDRAAR